MIKTIKSLVNRILSFLDKTEKLKMTKADDSEKFECELFPDPNKRYEPGLDCSNMLSIPEHRSGWNHIIDICKEIHNPNGYIFVDFVEKIWCWKDLSKNKVKGIFFNNTAYYVEYSNIKMINGREYAILEENMSVYWNGEEWKQSTLDFDVVKNADIYGIFTKPWIGIIHNPTNVPEWFDYENSPNELLKNEFFQESLTYCKGIIVMSQYLKTELLKLGGWPCSIGVVYHPTEPCNFKWKGLYQSKHKLVQIGYWLRKMSSIWEVSVPDKWSKYWINRADYGFKCLQKEVFHQNKLMSLLQCRKPVNIIKLSDEEYDTFLQDSIIFLDLYDSSCNNAIIEAIVRHIPIIVNRLPATEEYLGKDYCLFFDSLDEVHMLLEDDELIYKAHCQLVELEQSGIYYKERFCKQLSSLNFLKDPEPIDTNVVVSLGVDCLPRAMATKFGFKKTKQEGEVSCCFDLAWHDYETTCRLIENGFKDYLDTTRLYINNNGHIAHRDYTIIFNHESDDAEKLLKFAKNDYELFTERYFNRIANFKNILNTTTEYVMFILHYKQYPVELVNVIKGKYPLLHFTILTINCPYVHESYSRQPTNIETITNNMLFYTVRKPMEDYLWYVHQDERWEAKIESILSKHIKKIKSECNNSEKEI